LVSCQPRLDRLPFHLNLHKRRAQIRAPHSTRDSGFKLESEWIRIWRSGGPSRGPLDPGHISGIVRGDIQCAGITNELLTFLSNIRQYALARKQKRDPDPEIEDQTQGPSC